VSGVKKKGTQADKHLLQPVNNQNTGKATSREVRQTMFTSLTLKAGWNC
jgi:hypothetical protein